MTLTLQKKRFILAAFLLGLAVTFFAQKAGAQNFACAVAMAGVVTAGAEMAGACSEFGPNSGACNLAISKFNDASQVMAETCAQ